MTIVLAFKHKIYLIPSCAAFSSQGATKHFHSKNCILTVCFMGHLLCHARPTQITSPWWLTTGSTATTVYTNFLTIKKVFSCMFSKVYSYVCKQVFNYSQSLVII